MNTKALNIRDSLEREKALFANKNEFRQHVLKHMKLRTVIKENHGSEILQLLPNHSDPIFYNIFATVGGDQATVYDDLHHEDYLALVVNFKNIGTSFTKGGELTACTWLSMGPPGHRVKHPYGDTYLAVAGKDPCIQILSLVEAEVVSLLEGHHSPIIALSAADSCPGLLLSLSDDDVLKLWYVPEERCLATVSTKPGAFAVALHPTGSCCVVSTSCGGLYMYQFSLEPSQEPLKLPEVDSSPQAEKLSLLGRSEDMIESMQFIPGDRLAVLTSDSKFGVWSWPSCDPVASWKVPSAPISQVPLRDRRTFGCTPDGEYICVGTLTASVNVYCTSTGEKLASHDLIHVTGPVRSCALSDDCRHLLAVAGRGYIFRYEYLPLVSRENKRKEPQGQGPAGGEEPVDRDEELSSEAEGEPDEDEMISEAEGEPNGEEMISEAEGEPDEEEMSSEAEGEPDEDEMSSEANVETGGVS